LSRAIGTDICTPFCFDDRATRSIALREGCSEPLNAEHLTRISHSKPGCKRAEPDRSPFSLDQFLPDPESAIQAVAMKKERQE
jgi:hypothetical protein